MGRTGGDLGAGEDAGEEKPQSFKMRSSALQKLLQGGGGFLGEDAGENGVDGFELAVEVESLFEGFGVEKFGDVGIGGDEVAET